MGAFRLGHQAISISRHRLVRGLFAVGLSSFSAASAVLIENSASTTTTTIKNGQPGIQTVVKHQLRQLRLGVLRRNIAASIIAWNLLAIARKPTLVSVLNDFASPRSAYRSAARRSAAARPGIALALHLKQYHRAEHQRHPRQHLVGNTKQGPQRVDAAKRVNHALMQKVAPRQHAQRRGEGSPAASWFASGRADHPEQILQHKARRARAGIHRGQDKQRLEQNREDTEGASIRPPSEPCRI